MTNTQLMVLAVRLLIQNNGHKHVESIGIDAHLVDIAKKQLALIKKFYHNLHGFRELFTEQSNSFYHMENKLAELHVAMCGVGVEKSFEAMICPLIDWADDWGKFTMYEVYRR